MVQRPSREQLLIRLQELEERLARLDPLHTITSHRVIPDGSDQTIQFRFQETVGTIREASHIVDRDLRIVFFSDTFREWNQRFGLDVDPVGRCLLDVFPFLPEQVADEYQTIFTDATTLTTEEWVTVGSAPVCTETRKIPLQRGGRVDHVLTLIKDVTEIKRDEQALGAELRLNAALADLSKVLLAADTDIPAITRFVLDTALALTESTQGCITCFGPDESIIVRLSTTEAMEDVHVTRTGPRQFEEDSEVDSPTHASDSLAYFSNTPRKLARLNDAPPCDVTRMLSVPVIVEGNSFGCILLADVPRDYTRQDLTSIERLIAVYALGLHHLEARDSLIEHRQHLEELIDRRTRELRLANEKLQAEITERQRTDQALRLSEEMYRTLVENAGESIATVDEDGIFRFMNTVAAQRLGGKAEDFVGRSMWDLFPKEIADRQARSIRTVIRTGQGMNVMVSTNVRGQSRWYSTTIEPIPDSEGRIFVAMVIARDIHELKQAQDQIERHREEMAHTEHLASLGTLSATVAHELTQPLSVVSLAIENARACLDKTPHLEDVHEDLSDALQGIEDISAVINRFRRFAGRSAEKGAASVNLHAISCRVIRLLDEQAWRTGITVTSEDLQNLPPIVANEKDMEQMFFLLMENAIQAAHDNRANTLAISGQPRGEAVELVFTDDCTGIAREHLDRVFEPFFSTKSPGEGTGLGLCVVDRIVSRVGGDIRVTSRQGKGTRFRITLPMKPHAR